jgi:hypothetical protein
VGINPAAGVFAEGARNVNLLADFLGFELGALLDRNFSESISGTGTGLRKGVPPKTWNFVGIAA